MPELSTLAVFIRAGLAVLLIPGPAVLFIVAPSLEQGRRAGIVSALLARSGLAFTAIK